MITSTSSGQVKHVIQLLNKARARKEYGEFVVEGAKMVLEAPMERIVKVYASETFAAQNQRQLAAFMSRAGQLETVADSVFLRMCDTRTPQGVLAVVRMCEYGPADLLQDPALILGIENLQDPGNLGTIVRMGEGAGVTGIFMSTNTVDIYNPKCIRSTMGSVYRVPFFYAKDFTGTVENLRQAGVTVYAAHLDGIQTYTEANFTRPSAFLIGNEGNGLTAQASASADTLLRIPMAGKVESLNAAVAATVLTYEAMRQRR